MAPEETIPSPDPTDAEGPFEYVEEVVEYRDTRGLRTFLGIVLVLLILLLVGVSYVLYRSYALTGAPQQANANGVKGMVWVRSIYGWGGAQSQQLVAPNTVAVSPDGTIWSNSDNHTAVAFTTQGKFVRQLSSNPATQSASASSTAGSHGQAAPRPQAEGVSAVYCVATDAQNNLYVSDDAQAHLLKFTPEGSIIHGWSIPGLTKMDVNGPRVAVLSQGSLGVFNQDNGAPVYTFGTRGQGAGQLDLPVGVHIDDQGNVYVADTQNRRIRKFSPAGKLLWDAGTVPPRTFETHVTQPTGLFQLPTGVTTDANGRVEVIDAFNYNITVLDPATGKKIATYGQYGQEDGYFDNPSAIAYDKAHDYFVIADTGNNRLQVVRIPASGKATAGGALFDRATENPAWVLCCPFILLVIAIIVTALVSRRRRARQLAEAGAASE